MSVLSIGSGRNKPNIISIFACFVFVCVSIVPVIYSQFAGKYLTAVYALLLAVWLLELVVVTFQCGKISRMLALALLYLSFLVCFAILNLFNFRQQIIAVVVPLFPVFAYCHYVSYKDTRSLQNVAIILLLLLAVTFVTTVAGLQGEKYLLRLMPKLSVSDRFAYYNKNIGNISHVYAAGLVLVTFFSKLKQLRRTPLWLQLVALTMAVAALLLVIMGSSGITLLSCAVGLLWLLLNKQNPVIRYLLIVVVAVLLVVCMDVIINSLLSLSEQIENYYISGKLADIALSLQGGEAVGAVADRTDRYWSSLETFLRSFGLGVGPQYAQVYSASVVDGHSQLFGDMARYGILWLIGAVTVFLDYTKSIKHRNISAGIYVDNGAVYITFLLMLAMQPVLTNIEITSYVFLVFPFLDPYLQRKAIK